MRSEVVLSVNVNTFNFTVGLLYPGCTMKLFNVKIAGDLTNSTKSKQI